MSRAVTSVKKGGPVTEDAAKSRSWRERAIAISHIRWLRRTVIGIAIALILFTILGFFVIPAVLRHVLKVQVAQSLALLQPVSTATTVRTDGHEVLVADGPFAETKEVILGYDVIECADLDEAIFAASRHPVARNGGVVEVRPVLAY